jgi:hypothetical protein
MSGVRNLTWTSLIVSALSLNMDAKAVVSLLSI